MPAFSDQELWKSAKVPTRLRQAILSTALLKNYATMSMIIGSEAHRFISLLM